MEMKKKIIVLIGIVVALFSVSAASCEYLPDPTINYKFTDEFNGTSLDLNKWRPNWLAGSDTTITKPVNGAEESCYDPAQVSVSGGYLHLKAVQRQCRASNGQTYNYASGLIQTYNKGFTYTYGHLEARVFMPGNGSVQNWPAIWANGAPPGTWPHDGENDMVEGLNGKNCYHFHSDSGGPGGCANMSPASGWHIFRADWEPGKVTYIYDGNVVGTITQGITSSPMYLIANYGISSELGGPKVLPSELLVDYIRVW
jgi:beta-glucanase (GH16 family)